MEVDNRKRNIGKLKRQEKKSDTKSVKGSKIEIKVHYKGGGKKVKCELSSVLYLGKE